MAVKFKTRPDNVILVPFETARQREVLTHQPKMSLDGLYELSEGIYKKCRDTTLITTTTDTVHYDSERDEFSFLTDDGCFHTLMTDHSKSQMCTKLGIPVRFLQKLQGAGHHDLASDNINTLLTTGDDYKLFLRMYEDGSKPYLRGMLTPSYSPMDTNEVIGNFMDTISDTPLEDYKIKSYTLTPERFHLRMTGPKLNVPGEDLFSGIQIDSSDVGKSRLSIKYLIYKLVCKNGLMIAKKDFSLFEQIHKGISPSEFRDRFLESIERLPELAALSEQIITYNMREGETYNFEEMTEEDMIRFVSGIKRRTLLSDKSVNKVIDLMQTSYSPTRWGLVNSITEVAQDFTLSRRLELEKLAGDLLIA